MAPTRRYPTVNMRHNTATARRPWLRTLRWGVLLLGTLVLISLAGRWAGQRELQAKISALQQAAQANTLGLIGIAERHGFLPYVAARHPDIAALLQRPGNTAMQGKVNHYLAALQQHTDAAALYVMSREGLTLAASNWATPDSFIGQNYQQRPYFTEALQGRRSYFYGVGLTTGAPGFFIAEPVAVQGQALGVIVVKVSLATVEQSWQQSPDPIMLMDSRRIVFLSSEPQWLYHSLQTLSAADLAYLRQHGQYGKVSTHPLLPWQIKHLQDAATYQIASTLNGKPRELLALETPVPGLGWTVTVTSDLRSVSQARQEALALASLTAVVMLLAALYWRLREQRFAEQRRARQELELRVKERTRQLEEAQAFRKAMEDALAVGMQARDPDGRIVYVNRAFCAMVGYSAAELLEQLPPYPYCQPDERDSAMPPERLVLADAVVPHGTETRLRHRDGHEVQALIYTAPLINADGRTQGSMSSIVNITAQKNAENRQRSQERQLQRSARLASLGEMASTLAHELNQPLMAVSNFALAARALASQAQMTLLVTALDDIVEQSARASDIVKRVRGVINPRHGSYEACDIATVVEHALTLMRHELDLHKVSVSTALSANLPPVRANRVLLEQVLVNLLQNAMQALEDVSTTPRQINIEASQMEHGIEVRVADNGPGIAPDHLDQVFAPFFSTRSEGLGLGLAICRTIIEAHGGHLRTKASAAGGAQFIFSLPLNP
jgi:two-component system sensor histidine kinase DctS